MIAFVDRNPDVAVLAGEYRRLLGYPPGATPDTRALELEQAARAWYAAHGRPWVYAREVERVAIVPGGVAIGGVPFTPERLRRLMADADADRLVLVVASAGAEAEHYASELWQAGKPDEYYFIEMYASAVVEHLVMMAGARLCAVADGIGAAVLPHDSPGYPGWDVAEQGGLLGVIRATNDMAEPLEIDALDSGMLRPKKSLIAVFGLTRHVDRVRRLVDLVPCEECALERCQFRRRPHRRDAGLSGTAPPALQSDGTARSDQAHVPPPLAPHPTYSVSAKALRRWAGERVTLHERADGSIAATFRYDGTTCTNTGRPIAWLYHVALGPRADGYRIQSQRSEPAADDLGHTFMCRFISQGPSLVAMIAEEAPLAGQRLDDVLSWPRAHAPAGCFCDADSRLYKWGLVLETIHYALGRLEAERVSHTPEETRS
jgi:hypothetical protein